MDAPKESGRQSGIVKDARDILTQHYNTKAAARQPSGRPVGESANEYAAGKLEGMERDTAHAAGQTVGRATHEFKERTKAAKKKRRKVGEKPQEPMEDVGARRDAGRSALDGTVQQDAATSSKTATHSDENPGAAHAKRKLQRERAAQQRANNPYHSGGTRQAGDPAAHSGPAGVDGPGDVMGAAHVKTKANTVKSGDRAAKQKAGRFQNRGDRLKTAERMKKAAKGKAQSAARQQMVKRAQQLVKKSAAATKKAGELLARAAAALGRAIVSIAAACGPLVVIIVAIAIVCAIIASPFGLFFNGEDEDSIAAMQQTIYQISEEYRDNLLRIVADNSHDEQRFTFTNLGHKRADNWIDVLAIYAVQTANPDDGMEVVTLDPERIEKLRAIFWDMQDITYEVKNEPKYEADTDTSTDHYVLYIRATCKGAWEMANAYGFDRQQRDILEEMLNGAYDSYFDAMIGSAGLFGIVSDGSPVVGNGNFVWPSVSSNLVTSLFGGRTHPITGVYNDHYGIDISVGENTDVLAADAGTVTTATNHWSYGNYIVVDHGNGYTTLYAHNNSLLVSTGDAIEQGQQIALVGSTGVSDGFHIHFEVKLNGMRVDPLQFFSNYTIL